MAADPASERQGGVRDLMGIDPPWAWGCARRGDGSYSSAVPGGALLTMRGFPVTWRHEAERESLDASSGPRRRHPLCPESHAGSCIWAMPAPHCSTCCWRATAGGASSCASRTPIPSAAARSPTTRSVADLRWLGIDWDAGPDRRMRAGPTASRSAGPLRALLRACSSARGRVYPCFCTALELELSRRAQLAAGQPAALRGHLPRSSPPAERARALRPGAQPDPALPGAARGSAYRIHRLRARRAELRSAMTSGISWCGGPTAVPRSSSPTPSTMPPMGVTQRCAVRITSPIRRGSCCSWPLSACRRPHYGHVALLRRGRRRAAVQAPWGGERARVP